ncbi:methyl-CpG-binding domain-containing protein 4-like [Corylus avellana]|uniref:methyl-CpG-binding domain-containing protein 4-like n=1 Tax=Corylus avellana TaxID=13451 RepID=UPI00286B8C62|nr:methyl-CpG-binding domain-containing protein 4-like [Corylus avellana]
MKPKSQGTPKTPSKKSSQTHSIGLYAAQCEECSKWRLVDTQEEFEEIRSKLIEEPFYCNRKPDVSCEDPADVEYDATRTWVIDKPNIPKTPVGFKRKLVLRKDFSKLDSYFTTPTGKTYRTRNEIGLFVKENPEYKDVNPSDFDFGSPKVMEDTIPEHVLENPSSNGSSKKRVKSLCI